MRLPYVSCNNNNVLHFLLTNFFYSLLPSICTIYAAISLTYNHILSLLLLCIYTFSFTYTLPTTPLLGDPFSRNFHTGLCGLHRLIRFCRVRTCAAPFCFTLPRARFHTHLATCFLLPATTAGARTALHGLLPARYRTLSARTPGSLHACTPLYPLALHGSPVATTLPHLHATHCYTPFKVSLLFCTAPAAPVLLAATRFTLLPVPTATYLRFTVEHAPHALYVTTSTTRDVTLAHTLIYHVCVRSTVGYAFTRDHRWSSVSFLYLRIS